MNSEQSCAPLLTPLNQSGETGFSFCVWQQHDNIASVKWKVLEPHRDLLTEAWVRKSRDQDYQHSSSHLKDLVLHLGSLWLFSTCSLEKKSSPLNGLLKPMMKTGRENRRKGKKATKQPNPQWKTSCVACLLLCESGRETITQKNVIDINSREQSNTKHSQCRKIYSPACARSCCPFWAAISAFLGGFPQTVPAKLTLPLLSSSWTSLAFSCLLTRGISEPGEEHGAQHRVVSVSFR